MADTSLSEALDRRIVRRDTQRYTRKSGWGRWFGAVAIPMVIIAVGMHRLGLLDTQTMVGSIGAACLFAVMAVATAVAAISSVGRFGFHGLTDAIVALVYGLIVLLVPIWAAVSYWEKPAINDVTTDPYNPPAFRTLATGERSSAYDASFAPLQRSGYPAIVPLRAAFSQERIFELAIEAVDDLGWSIVDEVPPSNGLPGRIEAVATTIIFGFEDDIVVVVRAAGDQTRVDARSRSRIGLHDLGSNARRIDRFLTELSSRISSLPGEVR